MSQGKVATKREGDSMSPLKKKPMVTLLWEDLEDTIANADSSALLAQQSELRAFIQTAVKEAVNSILVPQLTELTRQIQDTKDIVSELAKGLELSHKTIQSNTAKFAALQATVRANKCQANDLQQQVGGTHLESHSDGGPQPDVQRKIGRAERRRGRVGRNRFSECEFAQMDIFSGKPRYPYRYSPLTLQQS